MEMLVLLHSQFGTAHWWAPPAAQGTLTSCCRAHIPWTHTKPSFSFLTIRATTSSSSSSTTTTTTSGSSAAVRTLPVSAATNDFLGGPFEDGELQRPQWSGDAPLSRFVAALISFKPLFALMTFMARQVLINSAEGKGVPWRQMSEECLASDVFAEKAVVENPSLVYPDYYLRNFHGYAGGNLSWKAASEVEPATQAMVIRAVPYVETLEEGNQILRGNWLKAIEFHHRRYCSDCEIRDILDIGCSTGVSTRFLANRFPSAQVTGLDLSPYFLAVAQHIDKQEEKCTCQTREKPIRWLHAKGEETGLPEDSFCIVSMAFVLHECPQHAIKSLLREAFRLLRRGGIVALVDTSPKSKIIQKLPPLLFSLMKSTEPWLDEYYSMDLEDVMYEIGFRNITSVLTDGRHKTVTADVP